MTEDKRIVSGENLDASEQDDLTLRPKTLTTYIGQEKIKRELSVYIAAAKQKQQSWWRRQYRYVRNRASAAE